MTTLRRIAWTLLALALLHAGAHPGQAEVGYELPPVSVACWEGIPVIGTREYLIDQSVDPWDPPGRFGTAPSLSNRGDLEKFRARYMGGNNHGGWPCGQALEAFGLNVVALENAAAGRCTAIPTAGAGGTPTAREAWDLAVTARRCGPEYRQCVADVGPGSRGEPLDATPSQVEWIASTAKACEPGVYQVEGPMCRWPTWYRLESLPEERPWCDEEPEPPTDPEPPACQPLEESDFWRLCQERFDADLEHCIAWATDRPRSDLGRAWPRVCEEEPEPPEPEPECWMLRYEPGEESTGKSRLTVKETECE